MLKHKIKREIMNKNKIGILAYGSLINDPGKEIEPLIVDRIKCKTPFYVEFARTSSSRGGAPTLIPFETGKEIDATILVLLDDVELKYAKDILWRRERHVFDDKEYKEVENPKENRIVVKSIEDFKGIETVIYTSLGKNIDGEVTADKLSLLAIKSILGNAGDERKDGIRYLLDIKNNSITTNLSDEYEKLILEKTKTKTLEEAIKKLDEKLLGEVK